MTHEKAQKEGHETKDKVEKNEMFNAKKKEGIMLLNTRIIEE